MDISNALQAIRKQQLAAYKNILATRGINAIIYGRLRAKNMKIKGNSLEFGYRFILPLFQSICNSTEERVFSAMQGGAAD